MLNSQCNVMLCHAPVCCLCSVILCCDILSYLVVAFIQRNAMYCNRMTWMLPCMHAGMFLFVCMYVCTYVCMYLSMYVCMYVYVTYARMHVWMHAVLRSNVLVCICCRV